MTDSHMPPSGHASAVSQRRLRFRRWLGVAGFLLLAVAVIGWFLPAMIAATLLKNSLVQAALPDFRGHVTLGRVSAGWFSPVRVRDVTVRDEAGEPLAEVVAVATEARLWRLLWDSQNIGEVRLHEPVLHVIVRDGGSNVEDALAPLLAGPSGRGVNCLVHIADGKCVLREHDSQRETAIENISADVTVPALAAAPVEWRFTASVTDGGASGNLATEGHWRPGRDAWGVGEAKLTADGLSLAALAPALLRCGVAAELSGRADVRGDVIVSNGSRREVHLQRFAIRQLSARVPQWLGSDTLQLTELNASGEAVLTAEMISLRDAALTCDIGRLRGSGETRWEALSAAQLVAALRSSTFDFDGEADLARLAQTFPKTLRLRPGLTVTSGVVRVECATRDEAGPRRWEGRLETANLAAVHGARQVTWEHPLTATFAVQDAADGPIIEQASCHADFVQASGRGSLAEGSVTVQGDLSKLSAELEKLVDLGEMQFGGSLQADLEWRRGEADQTEAAGNVNLADFQWSAPGRRPWREPQLAASFAAAGLLDENGARRIDRGQVELKAAGDSAAVRLRGPVENPGAAASWPIECEASGDFVTWLPRVENFISLADWNVEGGFTASAAGAVSTQRVQLESATLGIDRLYVAGAGLTIREPRVEAKGDLRWDGNSRSIAARQAALASSSIAFRAQNVAASLAPGNFTAAGEIDFRGDLHRIAKWRHNPQSHPTMNLEGIASGRVIARHTSAGVEIQGNADVENLAYSVPARVPAPSSTTPIAQSIAWTTLWREPRLRLSADAAYAPQEDSLRLKQFTAAGEALQLAAEGSVGEVSRTCRADLSGQFDYDLEKLLMLFRPLIGPDLKMTGRGPRPFTIRGPLFAAASSAPVLVPAELNVETSLAWTSAAYQGIPSGAGEAPITLSGGVAAVGPLDMPVSEGRLTVAPKVLLNASPMLATIDAGPVLQDVRISPGMCRTWLKYVAPLVADAAQAEGRFSIDLTQPARIPLEAPAQSEVHGVLKVHGAQVGPGPLSRQFLTLAEQVKAAVERRPLAPGQFGGTWLIMTEQNIRFEMAGGRIYHRDLQLSAGDVAIRTRGSVGVDQSLDLLAEVPIQDRWVEREPLLAGFRGQTLQVPVSGSLTSPRLDQRASEQFARQMLGDAARRLLEENLKTNPDIRGALDKLFGS
ncbi:MAG: hypothetical protein KY475_12500 [Planctomycetes bacterium]|nr:hypothetical protein [Planctomycetota bacterium]